MSMKAAKTAMVAFKRNGTARLEARAGGEGMRRGIGSMRDGDASSVGGGSSAYTQERMLAHKSGSEFEKLFFLVVYALMNGNTMKGKINLFGMIAEPVQLTAVVFAVRTDWTHPFLSQLRLLAATISTPFSSSSYDAAVKGMYAAIFLVIVVLGTLFYVGFRMKFSHLSPVTALRFLRMVVLFFVTALFMPIVGHLLLFCVIAPVGPDGTWTFVAFPDEPLSIPLLVLGAGMMLLFVAICLPVSLVYVDVEGAFARHDGRVDASILVCKILLMVSNLMVPALGRSFTDVTKLVVALYLVGMMVNSVPYSLDTVANDLRTASFSVFLWFNVCHLLSYSVPQAILNDILLMGIAPSMLLGRFAVRYRAGRVLRSFPSCAALVPVVTGSEEEPASLQVVLSNRMSDVNMVVSSMMKDESVDMLVRQRCSQWVYKRAMQCQGESAKFWVDYFSFCHMNGMSCEVRMNSSSPSSLDVRFAVYRYSFEKKRAQAGAGVGTVKYLDMSKAMKTAQKYHQEAYREIKVFWALLLSSKCNIDTVLTQLARIGTAESKAMDAYVYLTTKHSHSARVIRSYGIFLEEVHNDLIEAQKCFTMADALEEEAAQQHSEAITTAALVKQALESRQSQTNESAHTYGSDSSNSAQGSDVVEADSKADMSNVVEAGDDGNSIVSAVTSRPGSPREVLRRVQSNAVWNVSHTDNGGGGGALASTTPRDPLAAGDAPPGARRMARRRSDATGTMGAAVAATAQAGMLSEQAQIAAAAAAAASGVSLPRPVDSTRVITDDGDGGSGDDATATATRLGEAKGTMPSSPRPLRAGSDRAAAQLLQFATDGPTGGGGFGGDAADSGHSGGAVERDSGNGPAVAASELMLEVPVTPTHAGGGVGAAAAADAATNVGADVDEAAVRSAVPLRRASRVSRSDDDSGMMSSSDSSGGRASGGGASSVDGGSGGEAALERTPLVRASRDSTRGSTRRRGRPGTLFGMIESRTSQDDAHERSDGGLEPAEPSVAGAGSGGFVEPMRNLGAIVRSRLTEKDEGGAVFGDDSGDADGSADGKRAPDADAWSGPEDEADDDDDEDTDGEVEAPRRKSLLQTVLRVTHLSVLRGNKGGARGRNGRQKNGDKKKKKKKNVTFTLPWGHTWADGRRERELGTEEEKRRAAMRVAARARRRKKELEVQRAAEDARHAASKIGVVRRRRTAGHYVMPEVDADGHVVSAPPDDEVVRDDGAAHAIVRFGGVQAATDDDDDDDEGGSDRGAGGRGEDGDPEAPPVPAKPRRRSRLRRPSLTTAFKRKLEKQQVGRAGRGIDNMRLKIIGMITVCSTLIGMAPSVFYFLNNNRIWNAEDLLTASGKRDTLCWTSSSILAEAYGHGFANGGVPLQPNVTEVSEIMHATDYVNVVGTLRMLHQAISVCAIAPTSIADAQSCTPVERDLASALYVDLFRDGTLHNVLLDDAGNELIYAMERVAFDPHLTQNSTRLAVGFIDRNAATLCGNFDSATEQFATSLTTHVNMQMVVMTIAVGAGALFFLSSPFIMLSTLRDAHFERHVGYSVLNALPRSVLQDMVMARKSDAEDDMGGLTEAADLRKNSTLASFASVNSGRSTRGATSRRGSIFPDAAPLKREDSRKDVKRKMGDFIVEVNKCHKLRQYTLAIYAINAMFCMSSFCTFFFIVFLWSPVMPASRQVILIGQEARLVAEAHYLAVTNANFTQNNVTEELERVHTCLLYGCEEYEVVGLPSSNEVMDYFFTDPRTAFDDRIKQYLADLRSGREHESASDPSFTQIMFDGMHLYQSQLRDAVQLFRLLLYICAAATPPPLMVPFWKMYKMFVLRFRADVRRARFLLSLIPEFQLRRMPLVREFLRATEWSISKKRMGIEDIQAAAEQNPGF